MKGFIVAALVALATTGCIGTSSKITASNQAAAGARYWYTIDNHGYMSPEGLGILHARLDERLGHELAPADSPGAFRADVVISSYRMRHGAARALVGVMAGTDEIRSSVTIVDPQTGERLGRIDVESKNQTAIGSAGGLIAGHADEIADFLLAANGNRTAAPRTGEPSPQTTQQQPTGEMKWKPKGF